jgi:hypothetical protein
VAESQIQVFCQKVEPSLPEIDDVQLNRVHIYLDAVKLRKLRFIARDLSVPNSLWDSREYLQPGSSATCINADRHVPLVLSDEQLHQ